MKETKKNNNNDVHLYGYINGVRMNETKDGRTAINLNVATSETFKRNGEFENKYTFHDVVLFTKDEDLIKKFDGVNADLAKNFENKDTKGYKAKNHTVSLSGAMVQPDNSFGVKIIAREDSVDLDVKQADKEIRNHAELSGNIAAIDLYKESNFATLQLGHHIPGNDDKTMYIKVRIDGGRKEDMFNQLVNGELGVGDFIKVSGQLHNNNYDNGEKKIRGVALDANNVTLLHKKGEAVKETAEQEVKVEEKPAKKATSAKKAAAEKKAEPAKKAAAAPKKATSNKARTAKGVKMA